MNALLAPCLVVLLGAVALALVWLADRLGSTVVSAAPWIVALTVVALAPWLTGQRLLAPTNLLLDGMLPGIEVQVAAPHELLNDAVLQFLPWEKEIRRQWAHGQPAFWSPSLEGGSSLWQNPQAGVFSPIAMLARLFPLRFHLLVALALKMIVGGLGIAALATAIGARARAAALAGAAFVLSGPVIAWSLFPHTAVVCWVPWLCLAAVSLSRRPEERQRLCLCALLLALMLASGHPEVALAGGVLAALFALSYRRRKLELRTVLTRLGAAAALGTLLASPLLVPFALQLQESQRLAEMQQLDVEEQRVLGFEASRADLLKSFLSPYAYGRPYTDEFGGRSNWAEALSGSLGLVLLTGLVLALSVRSRASRVWRRGALPLLVFCALCWLAGAGWVPLLGVLRNLPLLEVLEYRRTLLVAGVALAALAAPGLELIMRRRSWPVVAVVTAVCLATVAAGSGDGTLVACVLLVISVLPLGRLGPAPALVVAAMLCSQVPWAWRMLPRAVPESFYPTSPVVERVAGELAAGGPWRAVGASFELYPALLSVWGVDEGRTHNPMAPRRYAAILGEAFGYEPQTSGGRYFSAFGGLSHPLLDFLNVRAVVQPAQLEVPPDLTEIYAVANRRVLLNPNALPRWFFPTQWRSLSSQASVAEVAELTQPRHVLVSGCGVPSGAAAVATDPRVLTMDPDDVVLLLPAERPPLLATSVPWSTGWRASADGRTLSTCLVNSAFLGVDLPAEARRLRLAFEPPGFRIALLLAAAAGLTLLWIGVGGLQARSWARSRR